MFENTHLKPSKCALLILLSGVLGACSQSTEPLNCNNPEIEEQLIQATKLDSSIPLYVSAKVIAMQDEDSHQMQEKNQVLKCKTTIQYSHNIFPEQNFLAKYTYAINKEHQVIAITPISTQNTLDFQNWLTKLPIVTSSQKITVGNLVVIQSNNSAKTKTHNQIQQLVLNQQLINLPQGKIFSTITIDKNFSQDGKDVFLLSAYYNDARDNELNHNYFITIESATKYVISQSFSYQDGSMNQDESGIVFSGYKQYPFSESNDFPLYRLVSGNIQISRPAHDLNYYRQKFSSQTAHQLMQKIKNDGCLNGDQFYLSDICTRKVSSYCFQFNSINTTAIKDKSYWLLNNMCKTQEMYQ
ncbi:MAG: hypothetical protein EKK54_05635 [Neisseriaceae bacterium]|nr:MAG: hypothetical protein EKK54_05635 [Neisseriaceae bacterium]